jgi:hypothetical protein
LFAASLDECVCYENAQVSPAASSAQYDAAWEEAAPAVMTSSFRVGYQVPLDITSIVAYYLKEIDSAGWKTGKMTATDDVGASLEGKDADGKD